MKKRYGILAAVLAVFFAVGCGGAANSSSMDTAASEEAVESSSMEITEEEWYGEQGIEESMTDAANSGAVTSSSGIGSVEASGQKLIKTVDLWMETREFDTLIENIQTKTTEIGGYVEASEISGLSYYNSGGYRYARLTLRIPSERLDEFVTIVSDLGNVISKMESVEDVTLQYVDTESHIEALETEQARLLELMEQAESMEDILSIENRLSQIRYELQSYESTLRTYDNQVNYSTVSVSVDEVERETVIEEDPGFFGEIRRRLSDNFYEIGQGIRSFGIWFISSLPYLVIILAALWIGVRLIQKIVWKKPFFRRKKRKIDAEDSVKEK